MTLSEPGKQRNARRIRCGASPQNTGGPRYCRKPSPYSMSHNYLRNSADGARSVGVIRTVWRSHLRAVADLDRPEAKSSKVFLSDVPRYTLTTNWAAGYRNHDVARNSLDQDSSAALPRDLRLPGQGTEAFHRGSSFHLIRVSLTVCVSQSAAHRSDDGNRFHSSPRA